MERTVLLLAVVPAVGVEASDVLVELGPKGYAIGSPTPETIANLLGLDLRGRSGPSPTRVPLTGR